MRAQSRKTSSISISRVAASSLPDLTAKAPVFQDGAFMVRKSSGQDAQQPYTLVVLFRGRVYNIPVRFIPATQQYALGREKRGEEVLENLFCFFLLLTVFSCQ